MKSKVLILIPSDETYSFVCPFTVSEGFGGVACSTWKDKEDVRYTHICTCKEI